MLASASHCQVIDRETLPDLTPEQLRGMKKAEAREVGDLLFARLGELEPEEVEYGRVRGLLIELHLPLVRYVAGGFGHRPEPMDDVVQVGVVGLIKAVDGYDPQRLVQFATYAIPTISGEIKRYFRDTSWPVHVPRGNQELYLQVARGSDELEQGLGRAPTTSEIAVHLNLREAEVDTGRTVSRAVRTDSLDAPVAGPDDAATPLAERLGKDDAELGLVDFRTSVRPLIEELPEREQRILRMRFWGDLTQSQIAAEVGVTQMHVSRLLAATMARLREGLEDRASQRAAAG